MTAPILQKSMVIMTLADRTTNEIMSLFEQYGNLDYDGEPVSQASHMIQCAMLAMQEEADQELILGALLHDIGHLLKHRQQTSSMGSFGVVNHEGIGAAYLRDAKFSARVCAVVDHHVDAKRFLVATESSYKENLSPASLQTLAWQGGPMTGDEAEIFRQHPHFHDIIRVRIWDEEAKDPEALLLPVRSFEEMINRHISNH